MQENIEKWFELISESGLFDERYYLRQYRDARLSDELPLEHYCRVGLEEDRWPNEHFDPAWYRDAYEDVKADGIYPIIHYILYGQSEGRSTLADSGGSEGGEKSVASPEGENLDIFEFFANVGEKNLTMPIEGFDKTGYLSANSDIDEMMRESDDPAFTLIRHLNAHGMDEIRSGKRRFHIDFPPFDEQKYLSSFPDIAEAVARGELKSAFEHFQKHGYAEIIKGLRSWGEPTPPVKKSEIATVPTPVEKQNSEKREKVIAVIGIPRSGLTLSTALIGTIEGATPWFLPFATRKDFGIEPFTDMESLRRYYIEAFPGTETPADYAVISESTSDTENISKLFESLKNIKNSGTDVKVIWIIRDIRHTYLSQMEAAYKYWGADKIDISPDTFRGYVDFAKNGYLSLTKNLLDFDTMLLNYDRMVSSPLKALSDIASFAGIERFRVPDTLQIEMMKSFHVAGDPGFSEFGDIISSQSEIRELEWESHSSIFDSLGETERLFVSEFGKLNDLAKGGEVTVLRDYMERIYEESFDISYYLSVYEDISKNASDPLAHYRLYGWKENRNPSPSFETKWYRENVFAGDDTIDPFTHYLLTGRYEVELGKSFAPEYEGIVPPLKLIDPESYQITPDLILEAPKFKNPKVSIIIPAYNQENYTLACIESIITYTENVSYEIIVMDDKSPNESAREIERNLKNVKFITNGINYGFLQNCNKGANFAIGEYILFLNNDTNVQPGWLSSLVELMESADNIGMVGSRLVYPDGRQQEAGGIVWKDASAWNYGRLDDPSKPEYNYVKESDYISGAAIMIKSDLWEEIGGFDERYIPAYFEDTDLAFEVRNHGQRVMFQPASIVVHFEGISHGTDTGSGIKKYQAINMEKFVGKWHDVLERENFDNAHNVFLARDRSRYKKHILYVDHYIPHYDKDAGSKATIQYLKILCDLGYKVHFIGDNFYHYPGTPYMKTLHQMGIEVLYGNWFAEHWKEWFKENGKYFSYVILSRPHISVKYIDTIRDLSNAKIIYMGHDLHFLRERREFEVKKDKKYLESSKKWKDIEMDLIKKSDVSYYFSDVEKTEIQKVDPSASVDIVPLYIYSKFNENIKKAEERSDIMFVGGFSHTPNVDAMLWFVNDIWSKVSKNLPDVKLYIIGSNPPREIQSLASNRVVVTGFVTDEELDEYYKNCKVVIAPLRYGAGVKGKIVDALYQGMPVVTTSIGAEGLVNIADTMMIADEPDKFAESVIKLYINNNLSNEYADKALKYCKKYFSTEYAVTKLSHTFVEISK